MAAKTEKDEAPEIDRGEEYVDFMIPFSGESKPELIGVNGEFIRVQPGVQVRVKRKYAEAWENSQAQAREAWKTQIRAQEASRKALAEL